MKKRLHVKYKQALMLCLFLISSVSWGQNTVTYDFDQSEAVTGFQADPPIALDSNIGFASYKNDGTANPAINGGQLRLYQNTTKGGSIKVLPKNGAVITKVVVYASGSGVGPAKYSINGGAGLSVSIISGTYTINSVNATNEIEFYSVGSSSSTRVYVDKFDVTYTMPATTPTATTTAATALSATAATFNGSANANGFASTIAFEYGSSLGYGTSIDATPSSLNTAIATAITANVTGLSVNTQYNYRAVITANGTSTNGDNMTFWTLANPALTPMVGLPQVTSLSISLNATDGNPDSTEYAIQETTTNQYVQADGSLATTPVWNSTGALGWNSPITVTGLTANTNYTFQVKARNGANVETAFSPTASATTLPNTAPTLEVNTLNDFATACINTTSAPQTLEITGFNLDATAIQVGPLEGFSFSIDNGATYNAQVSLSAEANGDLIEAILVQFTPTAAQNYNGNIAIVGGGANPIYAAVIAQAINTPKTVVTGLATELTTVSVTLDGTVDQGCAGDGGTYGFEYSTTSGFANGAGITVYANNYDAPTFTSNITGLQAGTTYYYKGLTIWSEGTAYGLENSFTTSALLAPIATTATNLTSTGFTANWTTVVGADSYALDVYSIEITSSPELLSNGDFENTSLSSFTFESGMNQIVSASQQHAGEKSLYSTVNSTKNFNQDITVVSGQEYTLRFWYYIDNSASGNGFRVWTTVGTDVKLPSANTYYNEKGSWQLVEGNFTASANLVKLNFRLYNGVKIYFDDLSVKLAQDSSVSVPVLGSPFTTGSSQISYNLTNLSPEKEYFYTVRAISTNSTSPNSNDIAVTTLVNTTTTYENGTWTNGVPTATMDAVIVSDFTTTTDLAAQSLTVTSGIFTVATGTTLTVENAIINNAGAANFMIENEAIVMQNTTAANTGDVTVNRNSANVYRQDYTAWSAPVTGQNLRAFSPQTIFSRFLSYSNDTAGPNGLGNYQQELFTNADVATKTFNAAQGFLIRMPNNWTEYADAAIPGTPYVGAFQGALNNGTYTIALSNGNVGFNLVGNPYPSPISIEAFFAENTTIAQTLYFWRKRNGAVGTGYATYSGLGTTSLQPEGAVADLDDTIKPGQGFYVTATEPTTLTFTNAMRTAVAEGTFFKTANNTETSRLWLNLSNATDVVAQTLIGYTAAATQGIDNGIDALYFNDSALALTSLIGTSEYAIQGRSVPFAATDIVPLGFKSDEAGSFTISLPQFDGLFATNQDIFLKDNTTGIYHDLKTSAYSFTTESGVFNNRFEVHYMATLSTDNPEFNTNGITIGVKNQQISINAGSKIMQKIELIDASGRVIYTMEDVNATATTINTVTTTNQMLIVRIRTAANEVVNQKIIF